MILSMTGFGKAVKDFGEKTITVEIKSLNSRSFDLNLRIPGTIREKELDLRAILSKQIERGKVDFSVYIESRKEQPAVSINTDLALGYHSMLKNLAGQMGEQGVNYLDLVVKMPDVIKSERKELDETEWQQVNAVIQEALVQFNVFRRREGEVLEEEFKIRVGLISGYLLEINALDENRGSLIRERIRKKLEEMVGKEKVDENRFEQELIYYIEKIDINEEKKRLQTHCEHFVQTMKESGAGRKLNFISQEMGREINTIGSKANDAAIQKLVVQMKDELEKIKEQTNNVL